MKADLYKNTNLSNIADPHLFLFVLLISTILLEDKNFPITPRIIPMKGIIRANIPTANATVGLLFFTYVQNQTYFS